MPTTTAIPCKPILFSAPMVRAILDGRKTQTRRVIKPQPEPTFTIKPCHFSPTCWAYAEDEHFHKPDGCTCKPVKCPYGTAGSRLWVRETWLELREHHDHFSGSRRKLVTVNGKPKINSIEYLADTDGSEETERCRIELGYKWKPSIHMPRWASRITLEITDVRVERLQDISPDDAVSEGIGEWAKEHNLSLYPTTAFLRLWNKINGDGSWESNPWVWVVKFKRI